MSYFGNLAVDLIFTVTLYLFYLFIYSAVAFNFVSEFLESNDPCRMQIVKLAALPSSKTGLKSARGRHVVGARNALKVSEWFFLLLVYAWTRNASICVSYHV